jgi:hydroxyacylglutathione hydrolase
MAPGATIATTCDHRSLQQGRNVLPTTRFEVHDFLVPGLGDRSYVVVAGDDAIAVDPQRDVERYIETAEAAGACLTHVLETHVHNDYVSGGLELARRTGAGLLLPEGSGAAFDHLAVGDGFLIDAPDLRVRALRTPGHTPEHTSYVVEPAAGPSLLFSGGSLLAGSAGRTDLAGPAWTDRLTASQYVSVRRLAALAEDTVLYPTHGAGSFCAAGPTAGPGFSTIAVERRANLALQDADPLAFARRQLVGLSRHPAYYAHMAPINRAGSRPLGTIIAPPEIGGRQLAALRSAGVLVVDGRPRSAFAAQHIAGSLAVELDDSFATYVGWLLPFDAPIALVLEGRQDAVEAVRQLARIGFERVRGVLRDIAAAAEAGAPLASHGRGTAHDLVAALGRGDPPLVLDVRQPAEWATGTIPGSVTRFVADLADPRDWLGDPARPVWTVCQSGYRAAIAASLLAASGYDVTAMDGGGVDDVLATLAASRVT